MATAPPSWSVATWYVDPQNVSTTASDLNSGTSTTTALRTWAELVQRWGTVSPQLRQTTTVIFLSSHTDNSDPVVWTPFTLGGASVIIQGLLNTNTQVGSGTLSGVSAKSAASGSPLIATLPGSAAVGNLVVNSTHPARAIAAVALGAGSFKLCQPLNSTTGIPNSFGNPSEVDTWTGGDSVIVYALTAVNVVKFAPTPGEYSAGINGQAYLYQCTVFDPGGAGVNSMTTNLMVNCTDCTLQRRLNAGPSPSSGLDSVDTVYQGCFFQGGCDIVTDVQDGASIIGGGAATSITMAGGIGVDGDFLVLHHMLLSSLGNQTSSVIGQVMGDATNGILYLVGSFTLSPILYALAYLSGFHTVDVTGSTRLACGPTAANSFRSIGSLTINGQTTASAYDDSGDPGVWHPNRNVTPTNLDTVIGSGGFGGRAIRPGGACILVNNHA